MIEIAAPPERVWEVVMDPMRLEDWVTIHRHLGEVSSNPLQPGARIDQTLSIAGIHFHVHWTVERIEAPHTAVWEGRGPAHSVAHTRYELSADGDGGTRFEYHNEFKPPGGLLGAAASRVLVGGISEREAHRSLARLKALIEGGAAPGR